MRRLIRTIEYLGLKNGYRNIENRDKIHNCGHYVHYLIRNFPSNGKNFKSVKNDA